MVQGQKYQSSTSPVFVIKSSRHKGPEMPKALPSHDVVMFYIKGSNLPRGLSLPSAIMQTCTLLLKSNGIFLLRWQNVAFIFKVQTWNFVCGIRRSFAFTMENILNVWYTATPGWTSKLGKVWKTRCQNAATRADIWRCFLVSWDDKYLWVMVSNNRHELYFCSKLLCFSSIHCFFGKIRYLNIRHERTLTSSPLMLICSERCRETQEREPAHTGWCLVIQPQKFPRYFEIGS